MGALLSTALLYLLSRFEAWFGMPQPVLYSLMPVTGSFAVYSFACYVTNPRSWKTFLGIIAAANALYCCLTAVLVAAYFPQLTAIGVIYFVCEIVLILLLTTLECQLVRGKL